MPDESLSFSFPNEIYPSDWFTTLNLQDVFCNDHPVELDLGCGDGSFLMKMAEEFPDKNFIGVERLLGRVRKVCRKADRLGLKNVRLVRIDSNYAMEWLLPAGAFSRIHFLCPDPWPKKKHARRRQMCQLPFLKNLHSLLEPGGELIFKTDSPDYFEEASEVQKGCDFFEDKPWPDSDSSFFYPQTDFEQHWIAKGRSMHVMRLKKVSFAA